MISLIFLSNACYIGCDKDDDSNSNTQVKVTKNVLSISNARTEIEVDGPITLVLAQARLYKQRPSCSGFEPCNASAISIGDAAEYTYITHMESDYANRTIYPSEIRFFRYECLYPANEAQLLLDSDKDDVADINDAWPNDPTRW